MSTQKTYSNEGFEQDPRAVPEETPDDIVMKRCFKSRAAAVASQFAFRRMGFDGVARGTVLSVRFPQESAEFAQIFGEFTLA
jgi:hypothetical protein